MFIINKNVLDSKPESWCNAWQMVDIRSYTERRKSFWIIELFDKIKEFYKVAFRHSFVYNFLGLLSLLNTIQVRILYDS